MQPGDLQLLKQAFKEFQRDSYGRLVLGDVIVGINGMPVKKEADLFDVLDSCKVGDTVKVDVLSRGTEKLSFNITLKERTIDFGLISHMIK